MNWKRLLAIIYGLALLIVCCAAFYTFGIYTERNPLVKIESLLLSVDDFPKGWLLEHTPEEIRRSDPYFGDWGEEGVTETFKHVEGGYSYQKLLRFQNRLYAFYAMDIIYKNARLIEYDTANYANYKSRIADWWTFACRNGNEDVIVCEGFAIYGEYGMFFSFNPRRKNMSAEQMEVILKVIDSKMAQYLKDN